VATARVNDLDLYYEDRGEGPSLLGLHGTPSSALLWREAATKLASLGRCIIYDRRGFGQSARPDPFDSVDLDDEVDDATVLLKKLGAAPAIVIGRSTGGLIAVALALASPESVRALVLLEPALFSIDEEATQWAAKLREAILTKAAEDPAQAAEAVLRLALGDETWESLPSALQQIFASGSPALLAEIRGVGLDLSEHPFAPTLDDLGSIDRPTLLVSAEDSPEALQRINRRLAHALAQVRQVSVPGGHLIDPAHPEVMAFVKGVLAKA